MHRTDIQVRFLDTDALGHLNNTSYAAYAEQARIAFFEALELGGVRPDRVGLILARIALDFRRQVRYGDAVHVTTAVGRVGRSSVTLRQTVWAAAGGAAAEVAAEIESVVVLFDYRSQRPSAIPEDARAALEAHGVEPS